ncbi:hypothetical protein HYY72_01160 [Candidatus Woesearchaeota archaeon]|nr:hypothetical protein [Candidatus Woesearchaeota archaeon]
MTDLVACLGTDERVWEYLKRLIERQEWGNVYLISGKGETSFKCGEREAIFLEVDTKLPLQQLTEQIRKKLDSRILDTEAAVNISLGTGKEHMALISALLKLGLGIRLVAYTPDGVREI